MELLSACLSFLVIFYTLTFLLHFFLPIGLDLVKFIGMNSWQLLVSGLTFHFLSMSDAVHDVFGGISTSK